MLAGGAVRQGGELDKAGLNLPEPTEPVHGRGRWRLVAVAVTFEVAQRGQSLEHAVVPLPARWDDAGVDVEAGHELGHPRPQLGEQVGALGGGEGGHVDRSGELAEAGVEVTVWRVRAAGPARLSLTSMALTAPPVVPHQST